MICILAAGCCNGWHEATAIANPIAAAATDSLYVDFFNLVRRGIFPQQPLIVERTAIRRNVANCRRTKSLLGYRRAIQTGDGPEFYRWTFGGYWTHSDRTGEADTECCIESFSDKFRDERLNEYCEQGFEILAGTRNVAARLQRKMPVKWLNLAASKPRRCYLLMAGR